MNKFWNKKIIRFFKQSTALVVVGALLVSIILPPFAQAKRTSSKSESFQLRDRVLFNRPKEERDAVLAKYQFPVSNRQIIIQKVVLLPSFYRTIKQEFNQIKEDAMTLFETALERFPIAAFGAMSVYIVLTVLGYLGFPNAINEMSVLTLLVLLFTPIHSSPLTPLPDAFHSLQYLSGNILTQKKLNNWIWNLILMAGQGDKSSRASSVKSTPSDDLGKESPQLRTVEDLPSGRSAFLKINWDIGEDPGDGDTKIVQTVETVQLALKKFDELFICTHLGRPTKEELANPAAKDKFDVKKKVLPIAKKRMTEIGIEAETVMLPEDINALPVAIESARKLYPNKKIVFMLPNSRLYPEESSHYSGLQPTGKIQDEFIERILNALDRPSAYINEAIESHDTDATVRMANRFPPESRAAGISFIREVNKKLVFEAEAHGAGLIIWGGTKPDKIYKHLLKYVSSGEQHAGDVMAIVGALAYPFLQHAGQPIGKSKLPKGEAAQKVAKALPQIVERAKENGINLLLPTDHRVIEKDDAARIVNQIEEQEMAIDIGPETLDAILKEIDSIMERHRATGEGWIIANGGTGVFERDDGRSATRQLLEKLEEARVAGVPVLLVGGDMLKAVNEVSKKDWGGREINPAIERTTAGGTILATLANGIATHPPVQALLKEPESFEGVHFQPGTNFYNDGKPLDQNLIKVKVKNSAEQVLQMLRRAKEEGIELSITGHLRGVDGAGSSLDLPVFQRLLTRLGVKKMHDLPSTPTIASEFQTTVRFELADDPNVIEYVAPDYGITEDKPYRVLGTVQLGKDGRTMNGQKDAPAFIFRNLFRLKGIRIIMDEIPAMALAGGMESSNVFNVALISAASILSGANLSQAEIFNLAVQLENNEFGGLTGGQGHLCCMLGSSYQHVWLSGMKDEDGRFVNPYSAFSIPFLSDEQMDAVENHSMLIQAGKQYAEDPDEGRIKPVEDRTAALTNFMWTDLLEDKDEIGFPLHAKKLELADQYVRALKKGDFKKVIEILNEYVDIRDQLSKRWINLMLDAHQGKPVPPYALEYARKVFDEKTGNDNVRNGNYKDFKVIRDMVTQFPDAIRNMSPYTKGPSGVLIREARKQGIAIMPLGAGGPGANLIAVSPKGVDHLKEFLESRGLNALTNEQVRKILRETGGELKGFMPFKIGREPIRFRGFKELELMLPEGPRKAQFDQRKGGLIHPTAMSSELPQPPKSDQSSPNFSNQNVDGQSSHIHEMAGQSLNNDDVNYNLPPKKDPLQKLYEIWLKGKEYRDELIYEARKLGFDGVYVEDYERRPFRGNAFPDIQPHLPKADHYKILDIYTLGVEDNNFQHSDGDLVFFWRMIEGDYEYLSFDWGPGVLNPQGKPRENFEQIFDRKSYREAAIPQD